MCARVCCVVCVCVCVAVAGVKRASAGPPFHPVPKPVCLPHRKVTNSLTHSHTLLRQVFTVFLLLTHKQRKFGSICTTFTSCTKRSTQFGTTSHSLICIRL